MQRFTLPCPIAKVAAQENSKTRTMSDIEISLIKLENNAY